MKNIYALLMAFVFAMQTIPAFAYDIQVDGLNFNVLKNIGIAEVTESSSDDYFGEYKGDIVIPGSIEFEGVTYPVTRIGRYAFYACEELNSVHIPNTVTTIGECAFYSCEYMTSVNIPSSVTTIENRAFHVCRSLNLTVPSTVTYIGREAFSYCKSLNVTLSNSVTSIPDYTFSLSPLTYIEIPNGVTEIGDYAFNIAKLASINLPMSLQRIGRYAFYGCKFIECAIPNSVTSIDEFAFYYCANLESMIIPNTIESIKQRTFEGCEKLKELEIPSSVTNIGEGAFYHCKSLPTLVIPEGVESLGSGCFRDCGALTSISIPSTMTSISNDAFMECPKLENVYCYATVVPQMGSDVFLRSNVEYCTLYVPEESIDAYMQDSQWNKFKEIKPIESIAPGYEPQPAPDITLTDMEPYKRYYNIDCSTITYTRNFTNTNWNALYIPFAMSYDDWSADFEIARLNDVHQFDDNEDGVIDRTVLECVNLKDGSSIDPNIPYMIKAKEVGEKTITMRNTKLYLSQENSFDVTSWYTKFTFTGTYDTVTDMATQGHYALANGGLMQATSDAATLGAFRWYLDITDRNGAPAQIKGRKVLLSFDDGETTDISVIPADAKNNSSAIFTLSGVNVGTEKAALSKGVYISNGKKIIIK